METKCQLDATDYIYCRFYCMLNMFRAILCPSSGAREYYTDGRCLWYLVLWFSGCGCDVELKVMCPVCRLQTGHITLFPHHRFKCWRSVKIYKIVLKLMEWKFIRDIFKYWGSKKIYTIDLNVDELWKYKQYI